MTKFSPITADETAITAVIREETEAFLAGDLDRWSACHVQENRACGVCQSSELGIDVQWGWEALFADARRALANGAPCGFHEFENRNMQISVTGNLAWVIYEQFASHQEGHSQKSFETRILEKSEGRWRIVYNAFFTQTPVRAGTGQLTLDAEGFLIDAAEDGRAALAGHPTLTISAGRIRARRPVWDKPLQAAIRRAGELHGFFQQHSYAQKSGSPFRLPVILGEDDSGAPVICQLSVRDSVTFLETDLHVPIARHLAAARAIFGLSKGQVALAERIISGEGPTEAARVLGISPNTARTHLARIYEKTGVNSQTALVRLILSTG